MDVCDMALRACAVVIMLSTVDAGVPVPRSLLGIHPGTKSVDGAPSRHPEHYTLNLVEDNGAKVSFTPENPSSPTVNVTVWWSGVENPAANDFIGVYCPWSNTPDQYLDYIEVGSGNPFGVPYKYGAFVPFWNASASTWPKGTGAMSFLLPNIRCKYTFAYVRTVNSSTMAQEQYVVASLSTAMSFPTAMPIGVHLGLTKKNSEMKVIWNSDSTLTPMVKYWPIEAPHKIMYANGTSMTYTTADMCGSEAAEAGPSGFLDPGHFHTVTLTGLDAGKMYTYQVYQVPNTVSAATSFRANLPTPTTDFAGTVGVHKFLMWADMGTDQYNTLWHFGNVDNAKALGARVKSLIDADPAIGLITHVGDLSYGCGNGLVWEQWQNLIEPIASRMPYQATIGNHEYVHAENSTRADGQDPAGIIGQSFHPVWGDYRDDSYGECGVPTVARFQGTGGAGSNGLFWYSFNYGLVHFTVLSAENDFTPGSVQHTWVVNDLAAVDRAATPWVVVLLHRPLYCSEAEDDSGHDKHLEVAEHLRDALEGNFLDAKVDMVMTGHLHSYERTCALNHGSCATRGQHGIVHIRAGTAGGTTDNCKAFDPLCPNNDTMHFIPNTPWRMRGEYVYGFTKVTVFDETVLGYEFIAMNGTIIDTINITRSTSA